MPRSEAKKKEYNDTRKKKRHADKAKAEADAAAARVPSEGPSGDSEWEGMYHELKGRYLDRIAQIEWYEDHVHTWQEKYDVSAIREGQLTAELGQKERELEDLRREFKLWIREWKDEKAAQLALRLRGSSEGRRTGRWRRHWRAQAGCAPWW